MFWRMRREAKKKAVVTNARRTNTGQCRTRSWTVLYTLSVSIFGAFFFMPSLSSLCHLVYPRTSGQPEVGKSNVEISKGGSKSSSLLKEPLTPEEVFYVFFPFSSKFALLHHTTSGSIPFSVLPGQSPTDPQQKDGMISSPNLYQPAAASSYPLPGMEVFK